jgi:Fe-S-cluster containining protein
MFNDFPQFVKQTVCLNCDGCCRFKEGEQAWHAKIGIDEIYELRREKPGLARQIFQKQRVTAGGFLQSRPQASGTGCRCVFFDDEKKLCSIYHGHPFECRLYPFIIRRRGNEVVLSCHLACPFVQDYLGTRHYRDYTGELEKYFQRPDVLRFVRDNPHIPGDYDAYAGELEDVLVLDVPAAEGPLAPERWRIEHALLEEKPELAARGYAPLFLWQDFFRYDIRNIQGRICVFAHSEAGCFMPMPPTGDYDPAVTAACFARMREHNPDGDVSRIETVPESAVHLYEKDGYRARLNSRDVCYVRESLVGYQGGAYKSQRAQRNLFRRSYDHEYRPYRDSDRAACVDLFERWKTEREASLRDEAALHMLVENRKVHARAFEGWAPAGLVGRVVASGGKIIGYTFGYRLSDEMFCVALEVTDRAYKGVSEFLFHEFCADESVAPYALINVMDSFALPKVEQTKMSYRPALLPANYAVTREG